jgi:hypothetical protein
MVQERRRGLSEAERAAAIREGIAAAGAGAAAAESLGGSWDDQEDDEAAEAARISAGGGGGSGRGLHSSTFKLKLSRFCD